jgi:cysteine synthase B
MGTTIETERKPALGKNVLEQIGNTPLLRIERLAPASADVEIYAKAEWFNPGGSVKDRAAYNMILEGERSGKLKPGKIILDATSGNTGIAYALVGAVKGYPVRLCVPASASDERKRILRAYGVDVILTPADEGSDGAIRAARLLYRENPELYFYPDQYNNPGNWQAHYRTTAEEIWRQTAGRVTHLVAGLGTSGTFVGTTKRLKELNPELKAISLQPDGPFHGLEGLKHMPTAIVPGIYDPSLADENREVKTETAYRMVKRAAREEGLLIGLSSGAALAVALDVAHGISSGVVVTIFPDAADKYLSERFWDEDI